MAGTRKNTLAVMTTAKNPARNKLSTSRSNSKNSKPAWPANSDASNNFKQSVNKTKSSESCQKKNMLKRLTRRKKPCLN